MTSAEADDGARPRDAGGERVPETEAAASRRGDSGGEPTTTRSAAATPAAAKSSPLGWLVDDLGLKLVALVLAITTWVLVRDQIQDTKVIEGVVVVLDRLPPSIRANGAGLPRVTLRLEGTAGAVERARLGLEGAGHQIRLRLPESAESQGSTPFANVTDFAYPFSDVGVVASISPSVRVEWYRVATLEVGVEFDKTPIEHPGRVDLEATSTAASLERNKVVVTGPSALIEELRRVGSELVPDAVSADKWLRTNPDLATPFAWSSGFSAWRAKEPERRAEWLVTIDPPAVAGKTRFREYKTTPAQVDLALLYPAGLDATAYEKFDVKILDTGYDARTGRLGISVRGDPALIASLGDGRSGWTLLVNLPPPPKDETETVANVPAPVVLVPPDSAAGEASPRLRLVTPRTVFVTLARRKAP